MQYGIDGGQRNNSSFSDLRHPPNNDSLPSAKSNFENKFLNYYIVISRV